MKDFYPCMELRPGLTKVRDTAFLRTIQQDLCQQIAKLSLLSDEAKYKDVERIPRSEFSISGHRVCFHNSKLRFLCWLDNNPEVFSLGDVLPIQ